MLLEKFYIFFNFKKSGTEVSDNDFDLLQSVAVSCKLLFIYLYFIYFAHEGILVVLRKLF